MGAEQLNQNKPATTRDATLSIYGYTDYRAYLGDFYEFKKQSSRGYSYRSFSKAAEFASPNYLKLVIDGQRNISPEAIEKFIKALRLSGPMAEYFRALVKMNQAKSDEEKEQWFLELKKLTPHAKKRLLNLEEHQYLSHWLYPVLREMIELDGFNDDPYWIARRIQGKATVQEITAALQFLLVEGFITKDTSGKYAAKDNMVITSDEIKNLAIRNYHRQMLAQAKDTLETLAMEEREFGALTIALPEHAVEELKFRLKTFRQETHQWAMQAAEKAAHDVVMQINFQMYPHTRRKTG
jgi:uncharacterized protein (TIGR02147 family)